MNCRYCSTELPDGALFCGECGRAVGSRVADAAETDEDVEPPAPVEPSLPEFPDSEQPPLERCAQCGAELAPTDIFCGECGFVRQSLAARRRPSDTNVLDPFPWGLPRAPMPAPVAVQESEPDAPEPEAARPEPVRPVPGADAAAVASADPPPLIAPPAPPPGRLPIRPEPEPDLDETRLVDRSGRGERFVLQFSTGESVSVTGTGLIGRNPVAEPGEYFDTFVTIIDPGRSVSKTHLEFGQESGAFWISDRFSGNGTIAREPERSPRRCDPGKRYRLVRGSRVDIGEQFFIVS